MQQSAGHRGPYAGTAERRRKIVEAAFDAFALEGFHGTTIKEISAAVGISKAGLLHHFASKEELLVAVLELREASNQEAPDTHGLGTLVHLHHQAGVDNATHGATALFVTMSAEATDPAHPAHEFFITRYEASITAISAHLEEARRGGELRDDLNVIEAAQLIVAAMDGLQLQMLLNPAIDRVATLDVFFDQFLAQNGAAGRPPLTMRDLVAGSESTESRVTKDQAS